MLRRVQRDLRDHFTNQAEEMNRSLGDSVRAAERSVKISQAERDRRVAEIKFELDRLESLQQKIRTLAPQLTSTLLTAERQALPMTERQALTGRS